MAAVGVVSACIARLEALWLTAEGGDVGEALETLTRDIREQRRQAGDLAAVIDAVELVASLSTPPGEPPTPAGAFFTRAAALLGLPPDQSARNR